MKNFTAFDIEEHSLTFTGMIQSSNIFTGNYYFERVIKVLNIQITVTLHYMMSFPLSVCLAFISVCLGVYLMVLRGYSCFCTQDLHLAILWGPSGMPRMKFGSVICNIKSPISCIFAPATILTFIS